MARLPAPAYWALWALGVLDRFILMLHCTSHRPLFAREHKWMNELIPRAIGQVRAGRQP